QSRPAQERAAVETVAVTCQGGGERAAPRLAFRSLDQHDLPSSLLRRIAIDPVEGLDVVALAVAALALLVVALAVGLGGGCERRRAGRHGTDAERAQDVATPHCPGFRFHRPVLLDTMAPLTRAAR